MCVYKDDIYRDNRYIALKYGGGKRTKNITCSIVFIV